MSTPTEPGFYWIENGWASEDNPTRRRIVELKPMTPNQDELWVWETGLEEPERLAKFAQRLGSKLSWLSGPLDPDTVFALEVDLHTAEMRIIELAAEVQRLEQQMEGLVR